MPDILVFAALAPKLAGAKIILDMHDPMPELMMSIYSLQPQQWLVGLLRTLERWSIDWADLALTPNVAFKRLFVSRGTYENKIQVVMNSPQQEIFDTNQIRRQESQSLPNGEFRVMHHGSIVHRHGIDLLVRAIAQIRRDIPEIRLDIYGSRTSFLDAVSALARELKVDDIIQYHGPKTQSEIADAITKAHVGVVPNRRLPFTEVNFPTRLFEYLAMGRPVVAPATEGIADYFGSDELITFEPNDPDDLAAKLLWVHRQPQAAAQFVSRGRHVYQRHLWRDERSQFLKHAANLVNAG